MTFEEIEKVLNEFVILNVDRDDYDFDDVEDIENKSDAYFATLAEDGTNRQPPGWKVTIDDQFREDDEYLYILKVLNEKTEEVEFVRFAAYYSSWDDHNYDDSELELVEPKEVTKTEWVTK